MTGSELGRILADSAAEVLESMFFTSPSGEAGPEVLPQASWISAALSFHGAPSGRFGVQVPAETGRRIAASFLGQEEETLTESQTGDVVCELANMLCGSVLSRVEAETQFDLSQPRIESPGAGRPSPAATSTFVMEEGPLAVWLDMEHADEQQP